MELQRLKFLDEYGQEIPDPNPVAIPAGFKKPETLAEQVARLVRTRVSEMADAQGMETFEEADDFEVDDEYDPKSPFEEFFDPLLDRRVTPQEYHDHGDRFRAEYVKRTKELLRTQDMQEAQSHFGKFVKWFRSEFAPTKGVQGGKPPAKGGDQPPVAPSEPS